MLERLRQQKPGLLIRKQRYFDRTGAYEVGGPRCAQLRGLVTAGEHPHNVPV